MLIQITSEKQKIKTPQKMMKKKWRICRQDLTENGIQQEVNNIKFGIKKTLNEMITELNSFFHLLLVFFGFIETKHPETPARTE